MPLQLYDELTFILTFNRQTVMLTVNKPVLRGRYRNEARGWVALFYFSNDVIHLLFLQTVPGFTLFLWDHRHNPSS